MTVPDEPMFRGLPEIVAAHEASLARLRESREAFTAELQRRTAVLEASSTSTSPGREQGRSAGKPAQIDRLVQQRARLDAEIAAHEEILALARDPRALDALALLLQDPAVLEAARADPHAYARARGVELPAAVVLQVDDDQGRPRVRVAYRDLRAPSSLTWDETGFRTP